MYADRYKWKIYTTNPAMFKNLTQKCRTNNPEYRINMEALN